MVCVPIDCIACTSCLIICVHSVSTNFGVSFEQFPETEDVDLQYEVSKSITRLKAKSLLGTSRFAL